MLGCGSRPRSSSPCWRGEDNCWLAFLPGTRHAGPPVVGGKHDDGVFGQPELVQGIDHLADVRVQVLHHARINGILLSCRDLAIESFGYHLQRSGAVHPLFLCLVLLDQLCRGLNRRMNRIVTQDEKERLLALLGGLPDEPDALVRQERRSSNCPACHPPGPARRQKAALSAYRDGNKTRANHAWAVAICQSNPCCLGIPIFSEPTCHLPIYPVR